MKKLLLFLTTISVLYGFQYDAKFYVGIGGGMQNESLVDDKYLKDDTNSPAFGSIKFGYGDIKAYSIEILLNYVANQTNVFSADDGSRYGLDVAVIKAFNFTDIAYPYIRGGFGAGEMSVKDIQSDDKLSFSSFNIGTGAYIPLTESIDMEISYEYRFTSYESIYFNEEEIRPQSHINQLYLGVNYRY